MRSNSPKLLSEANRVAVLDVRSDAEFNGPLGHIRGAVNIPVDELAARIGELGPLTGSRVVTVCRTDRRSASAAEVLRHAGFDTEVLRGGMEAWTQARMPVERTALTGGRRRA